MSAKVRARFVIKTQAVIWQNFFVNQLYNRRHFLQSFPSVLVAYGCLIKRSQFCVEEGRKIIFRDGFCDVNFFPFKFSHSNRFAIATGNNLMQYQENLMGVI